MIVLSWVIFISLSTSGTIGQDEVEERTFAICSVVLKASEGMKSTVFLHHLFYHCRTWELKHWSITTRVNRLWKPDFSFAVDFLHPLGYSSVKETVDPLQLYPLPVFKAKFGDEDKELWPSDLTAKFLWSWCLEMCLIFSHVYLLCSSIKTGRLGRYVHFDS